jgi:pimeloyl-ACP methyl ester carboxylesterase
MDTSTPNVVLVHGGFVDGSGWRAVYDQLKADGYNVAVVQNPTLSLEGDVAATKQVIDDLAGPVILVGHSYGGAAITETGTDERVAGLVYIAAFAPDTGENLATLVTKNPGTYITPDALIERPYPLPDGTRVSTYTSRPTGSTMRSPATCHCAPPSSCRPPSDHSLSPRSPSPQVRRRGRPSRPGTSSPPTTTPSRRSPSGSWLPARAQPWRTSRHPTSR